MDCPECNNNGRCKDGIVRGRERYQCKSCRFRYTVSHKSDVKPVSVKRKALELYLEGLCLRAIDRTQHKLWHSLSMGKSMVK
jgi:transposase-like protein